jgi:homogentisate 1,2-dioxygenase
MSEFMGLIYGVHNAKPDGFVPGAMGLHNVPIAHGPDAAAFRKGSQAKLRPERLSGILAFMFETRYPCAHQLCIDRGTTRRHRSGLLERSGTTV